MSRFCLSSDSYRILIWRERGKPTIIPRTSLEETGMEVAVFSFEESSRLSAMGLQFLFMDDNAPCHRTVAAEQLLKRLAARTLPPVTIQELRLALQDEWAAMPQQLIDTLILSRGRRCGTCLTQSGRSIISPTKDRMFLAGHHPRGMFRPSVALRSMLLFNKASFIPLISLLVSVAYITHVTYVLGILRY
ncbi:transposable element Tcb2 transposase [Trichonephila clavipes]|nr:transposable element Tcb2 transposase [Trichonephila clavipes]